MIVGLAVASVAVVQAMEVTKKGEKDENNQKNDGLVNNKQKGGSCKDGTYKSKLEEIFKDGTPRMELRNHTVDQFMKDWGDQEGGNQKGQKIRERMRKWHASPDYKDPPPPALGKEQYLPQAWPASPRAKLLKLLDEHTKLLDAQTNLQRVQSEQAELRAKLKRLDREEIELKRQLGVGY